MKHVKVAVFLLLSFIFLCSCRRTTEIETEEESITEEVQSNQGIVLEEKTTEEIIEEESSQNINGAHDYTNFERIITKIDVMTE